MSGYCTLFDCKEAKKGANQISWFTQYPLSEYEGAKP